MKDPKFAEIAIALPMNKNFHYSITGSVKKEIEIGKRVWVEFGRKDRVGYVVGFADSTEVEDTKPVKSVIDSEPIISLSMLELCKWVAETYMCSLGQAIAATVPSVLKKGKVSVKARKREYPARNEPGGEDREAHIRSLPLSLTSEQKEALKTVLVKIESQEYRTFLLHGITSSGKTEVYLQAIEEVLKRGRSSIVLVPEIALTPQTVGRFKERFGPLVAVVHSQLLGSMKYAEWKRIKDGIAKIVIGARSAIFSPVKNLGLIIVDEEHETSYKQEDVPRYHARDVALMRGRLCNSPVILGSATPSLETYYLAKKRELELVRLTKRIDDRQLPKAKIVDMRMELATRKHIVMFSRVLIDSIQRALNSNGQIMIFLNRRGFSTYINCKKCGLVLKCKRCDSVLVHHYQTKKLLCHYCNYRISPPDICPHCSSSYMKYFGIGTEKVESEIARIFPGARIARMDTDSTRVRGAHERILGDFKDHKIDILVGTQMIAKGLDFPKVTLVGIVNADVTLNLPDFRASERTFNLLTQVGGRAGRGADGGEVIIQTYAPEHYAILAASKHDYDKFYSEEIKSRKELAFPPVTHMIRLTLRGRNEKRTIDAAHDMTRSLDKELMKLIAGKGIEVLGPAPSPVSRVRGYFRWNILLKGKNRSIMCAELSKALLKCGRPAGVFVAVDVDPMSL
ncbi:MAG: primosomal protein N' [Candidatus Omnitrophota bacterium]